MAGEEGWEKDYKLKNPCRGGGEQPSFKDQIDQHIHLGDRTSHNNIDEYVSEK